MRYQLKDLVIDYGARTVSRGDEIIPLGRLSFEFLVSLIEQAPNLASFDDIIEKVWNGAIIGPETIAQRASLLRRAIRSPDGGTKYFEPVRGIGYRLTEAVSAETQPAPTDHTLPAAQQTLAIMPFEDLSPDGDQKFFCDGLVEDLITDLSQIPQLLVISRSASFALGGQSGDAPAAAEKFNVNYILQGSVRRQGERVRITTQLIDARTDTPVWTKRLEQSDPDYLAVQDGVADEIVTALDIELVSGEQGRHRRAKIQSTKARELLYRGMYYHYKFEPAAGSLARKYFQQVVEEEPNSSVGLVWLVTAWSFALVTQWEKPETAIPQLKTYIEKARAIDPDDPNTLVGATVVEVLTGNLAAGVACARRATEIAPGIDDTWFASGWAQMFIGRSDETVRCLTRAMRLSPVLTTLQMGVLGTAYRNLGRYQEAVRTFLSCIDHFPDFVFAHTGLAAVYGLQGERELALQKVEDALAIDPGYTAQRFATPDFYEDPEVMKACRRVLVQAGLPAG